MKQNIQYLIPRIKYAYQQHSDLKNKIILSFRLIILFCLIFFKKKEFIFSGNFGGEKFKLYLDLIKKKHGSRGYFLLREKQEPILEFGHKFLNEGDIVIDCGANQGIFSLSFKSKIKKSGIIFCIEPFDYATKKIKNNFILNKYNNFFIYKNIVSDKVGLTKIYYSEGITDASIVHKRNNYKIIKSITIDYLAKKHNLKKLNFIKLDIEGAEYSALLGAKNSISKFKPIIYLENNDINRFNLIINLLKKTYQPYFFEKNGKITKLKKFSKGNVLFFPKKSYSNFPN
tara:strand:- start:39 stop:896 length:858 start_codon:yes stop_codon:yes gene_type:complete